MTFIIGFLLLSNCAWYFALRLSIEKRRQIERNRSMAETRLPEVERQLKNTNNDLDTVRNELYSLKVTTTREAAVRDEEITKLRRKLVTDDDMVAPSPNDENPNSNPCAECGAQIPDESADYLCTDCRGESHLTLADERVGADGK